jgi:hypothetical protein
MKQNIAPIQTETGNRLAAFQRFREASATRPVLEFFKHPVFFFKKQRYEELQSKVDKAELAGAKAAVVAMGHEIGNALGIVNLYCQVLPSSLGAGDWSKFETQIEAAQKGIERTLGAIEAFQTIFSKMQQLPKIPYGGDKSIPMVDLEAAKKEAVLGSGSSPASDLERTLQAAEMEGARMVIATFLYGAQEDLYRIRGDLGALAMFSEKQTPEPALKLLSEMKPYLGRVNITLGDLRIVVSKADSLSFSALPNGSRLIDLSRAQELRDAEKKAQEEAVAAAKARMAATAPPPVA